MDFNVLLRSGFAGIEHGLGRVRLQPRAVGAASDRYASTHILRMDEHFDAYLVAPNFPTLPVIHDIGTAHPIVRQKGKQKATAVIGNIGEVAAALVVRRKLPVRARQIQHINTSRNYKTPDFHMQFTPMMPNAFNQVVPPGVNVQFTAWPVESKAAKTFAYETQYRLNALAQLGHYWFYREPHDPNVVGFGIIVTLVYEQQRRILITVITPSNRPGLIGLIQQHRVNNTFDAFITALRTPGSNVRQTLNNV